MDLFASLELWKPAFIVLDKVFFITENCDILWYFCYFCMKTFLWYSLLIASSSMRCLPWVLPTCFVGSKSIDNLQRPNWFIACWVIFHAFVVFCWLFSKLTLSENSFRNPIRVSNSLDSDQDRHFVGPDLGLNCLQSLSTDDKSGC